MADGFFFGKRELKDLTRPARRCIAGYDALYKCLIKVANLSDVSAGFSMECLKYTTELPLDYLRE